MNDLNEPNKSLLSSLEKRGLLEMTKAYFRTNLIETLKKDEFYNTAPSGFNNIKNINIESIKDENAINILRLQYSLINDFLIRTKMTYTQNIFSNEIKSLLENNIPFTDSEIIRNLNFNKKQISNMRLNSNLNSTPIDLIKNTYLYHLINLHSNINKIDEEAQTLFPNINPKEITKEIDLEKEMKKIDEKYNKMLDIEKVLPFNKSNEKKFLELKEECENKYKENLKNEIERFKTIELSNMRLEENKKYIEKIEKIREEYENIYEKKYEEIKNMKKILDEKEKMLEKEQDKRYLENNEKILSQFQKIKESNDQRESQYINEINRLTNEKNILEQTIEDLKEKFDTELNIQINKIKNNFNEQLITEKNLLKEESEREKKILINNYTNKNSSDNSQNILPYTLTEKNVKRKDSLEEKGSNIYLKNSGLNKKLMEDFHNRRKRLEEIDLEQERLNNKMKYEFKEIMDDHVPLVVLNQEEIDQIKNNNENINNINNIITSEKNQSKQKKSINENWNNINLNLNNKEIKSPYRNNKSNQSPIDYNKNKFQNNNSILNNNKNLGININNSIGNNNMGIPSANIFNNNINNTTKKSSGVIEENIDYENISSSQKSKEQSNKRSGNFNPNNAINNINNNNLSNNFGSNKKSIFPPINNNVSYSIKEEINISPNKSKSRMGSSAKKSFENNNFNNLNNINNKSSMKKNYDNLDNKEEEDDYGEGDFENNISSFNQASDKKQIKFSKIKNQNEKSISALEKIEKNNIDFNNININNNINNNEVEESYNDFDNTKGLINKGVNLEGSSGFNNNMSKFNNNININNDKKNDESEIKEDIEYDDYN